MSRPVRFAPYFDQQSKRWSISIPSKLSKTGRRQRLFYRTRDKAVKAARRLKERHEKFGVSLSNLDPVRLGEASEAYKLLDGLKPSPGLLPVVREWLAWKQRQSSSKPFLDVFSDFLESRPNLSQAHHDQIRNVKDKLEPLHKMLVADITPAKIQEMLSPLSGGTRNRYLRILRAIFNHAVKHEWMTENPVERLDFVKLPKPAIEIYSHRQIKLMLLRAKRINVEMVPYFALGAFAGLRAGSEELTQLKWSDIHFDEKQIVVRAAIAKNRTKRFIPMSDNLIAWLKVYLARSTNVQENVITVPYGTLRKLRKEIYRHKWIPAGLRHSYASAMINSGQSIDDTVLALGHRGDPKLLWSHYYLATSKEEAEKYWQISPK